MSYDVVGLGLCTHDYIAVIPHMPEFETSVKVMAASEQGGGPAATATVAAARLGTSAAFIGKVGDDNSGRFIIQEFQRDDVDVKYVQEEAAASSAYITCLVEESSGARAFISRPATVSPLQLGAAELEIIGTAKFLHIDTQWPAANLIAAEAANKAGTMVAMDASYWEPARPLLSLVDILIPSRFFFHAAGLGDDPLIAARKLLEYGPREVVITLGAEGCACANADECFLLSAFHVEPVVDTTGCGDVFHGAYIAAKLQGYDMRRSAQFASAAAAMKATKIGGRRGIPTLPELRRFLHDQGVSL